MASIRAPARGCSAALVAEAVLAALDIATGDDAFARSLYLLPVLALAIRAPRVARSR